MQKIYLAPTEVWQKKFDVQRVKIWSNSGPSGYGKCGGFVVLSHPQREPTLNKQLCLTSLVNLWN